MPSGGCSDFRMRRSILFAVTGHGFGHATRAVEIAAALRRLCPRAEVTFSTSVPAGFLERSGARQAAYRCQEYEPGTLESTCFEVDVEATRAAYRRFHEEREARIRSEAAHLRSAGYCGVVSDIAAVPIAAASQAGLSSLAVSNFTWDWVLEPLFEGDRDLESLVDALRADYRRAQSFLRLPFHQDEHPFKSVEDVPLVGRRASVPPSVVRRTLGLPGASSRPLVLVTIGGLGSRGWPEIEVDACSGIDFVVVGALPIRFKSARALFLSQERPGVSFPDLVGASDMVLAKPGYGICSECAANGRPLAAVERRGFREYGVLREGVSRLVPFAEVPVADFLAGAWEAHIHRLLAAEPPTPSPSGGAEAAARRIAEILGLDSER